MAFCTSTGLIIARWVMREVWMLLKEALRVKTVCRILSVLYLSQTTQRLELHREWSESIVEKHCYITSKVHRDTIGKTILNKRLLTLVKSFTCVGLWDWRLILIAAVRWWDSARKPLKITGFACMEPWIWAFNILYQNSNSVCLAT